MKIYNKYLILIPDLVSLEIDNEIYYKKLFKSQATFYGFDNKKLLYHFRVCTKNTDGYKERVKKRIEYESYNCGLSEKNLFWYRRSIFGQQTEIVFDSDSNTFYFEEDAFYTLFFSHIAVGEFYTAREILIDIIYLILFRNGFMVLPGFALFFEKTKDVFIAIVPRENGKTTFVSNYLTGHKEDVKYIADNQLVINIQERTCYPVAPFYSFNKKNSRSTFGSLIQNTNLLFKKKSFFKKIYFLLNSSTITSKLLAPDDYIVSSLLSTLTNSVMKEYILFFGLGKEVTFKMDEYLKKIETLYKKKQIVSATVIDYNYEELLK